jgi:hypothetical protein
MVSCRHSRGFGAVAVLLAMGAVAAAGADGKRAAATIRVPADKATIQAAIDAAGDGDVVLVAPGKYPGGIRLHGKSITLASQFLHGGKAEDVERTVLGAGKSGSSVIKVESDCGPDTKIVGFTIQGGDDGITCWARIQILNNHIRKCGDGIDYEKVSGGVCRDNLFEDNGDDAIDLDDDCDVVIERNVIRNCHDDGIEIRFHSYRGGGTLNIVVRDNVISGSGEDGIQVIKHAGVDCRVLRIERNLIRDTKMAAIGCMDGGNTREDYGGAPIGDRIYVVNNTLLDNHYGLLGGTNLIAVNNVFVGTKKVAARKVAGQSILAWNLFWHNGTDMEDCNADQAHTLRADPRLDAQGRPLDGSPCLEAGTAVFERDGKELLRIDRADYAGKAPNLGAFQRKPPAAR